MPDTTQRLLGQLADGRFQLRKLLGVSPNSAVFLTSLDSGADAAIKLVPEDPANSDVQLERWCGAAALSHPGLLKILYYGRCVIDGSPCLYVVTERADEDLGQLLPQRALSPDEARGMLAPVLAALDYLHEKGFVHAGVKPSNIHAIGDNVKLSSDRILAAGESSSAWPLAAPFAAPESVQFPASDIWSLGFTLCQTLTQAFPDQVAPGQYSVPALPAPFAEIVRAAIVEDATLRVGLDSVRSQLDPSFVPKRKPATRPSAPAAATVAPTPSADPDPRAPEDVTAAVHASSAPAAAQASAAAASGASSRTSRRAPLPQIDPLSVPLSPVEPPAKAKPVPIARGPIPVSTLPHVNAAIAGPRRPISPNPAKPRSNTLFLVAAAAAILLAIIFVPRMLLRSSNSASPSSANSNAPSTTNPATPENSAAKIPPSSSTPSANSLWTPPPASKSSPGTPVSRLADSKPAAAPGKSAPASDSASASPDANSRTIASNSSPAPASKNSAAPDSSSTAVAPPPSAAPAKPSAAAKINPVQLTVVRKILPEVSEKARATINGTVRITVRVQLNPDGTVTSAELANPAASQFFSALALKAAQQWQFGPPAASSTSTDDGALPSTALIRFDFTQISTSAYLP